MGDAAQSIGRQLVGFLPNLRRFALSLTGNVTLADDLVQQACERALAAASSFEEGTRFDAWLFRITRNLWIDRLRREKTAGPQDDLDSMADRLAGADGRQADNRLLLGSVWDAIQHLPAEQREVLVLVCVEELSYKETAQTLEIPIGTVMSRLSRARANLAVAVGIDAPDARSHALRKENP